MRDAHQDVAHNGSSPQQASTEVGTNATCAGPSALHLTIKNSDLGINSLVLDIQKWEIVEIMEYSVKTLYNIMIL